MPRVGPHPRALFSLVPINTRAKAVLEHPDNAHLISILEDKKKGQSRKALDIGPFIGSKSRYTLATIGRTGDIIVDGSPSISRIHCSFEVHEGNKTEVMLLDRSSNKSTKLFGGTAIDFEAGRPHRRVVIDHTINLIFGFGGGNCDQLQFQIVWHLHNKPDVNFEHREDHPRHTRTIPDEPQPPTIAPSRVITRIHTPGRLEKIRYSRRQRLGAGAFGEVWKVADVDTGDYLALKAVRRPPIQSHEHKMLKREVELLSRLSHRNIVEYISAQMGETHFEIIMELKPGSVEDLVKEKVFETDRPLAEPLLHQMLQALDYLAKERVVHRDLKPENMLYSHTTEGGYLYQLADFGLANLVANAHTFAGSLPYMAPELQLNPQFPQTTKMDVWSLFVTLVYVMNVNGYQEKMLLTPEQRIKAIQDVANEERYRPLQGMAIVDPTQRASAGDLLDSLFKGQGRVTSRTPALTTAIFAEDPQPEPMDEDWKEEMGQGDGVTGTTRPEEPKTARSSPREAVVTAKRRRARLSPDRGTEKQLAGPSAQTPALGRQGFGHRVQKNTRQAVSRMHGTFPADQDRPRRNFT